MPTKVSDLTELDTLADADDFYVHDASAGTPLSSKRVTAATIKTYVAATASAVVEVDGTQVNTGAPTFDFDGTDFSVSEGPTDSFDITINDENIQDIVGTMLTGNTETGIAVTYQDGDATIDFVVSDLTVAGDSGSTGMTPGDTITVAGAGSISTAMSGDTLTITGSGAFAPIEVDGVAVSTGIATLDFDGTDFTLSESPTDDFDITIKAERIQDIAGAMFSSNTETGITITYQDADGTIDATVADLTVAGDSGSTGMTPGDTLTIAGGTSITTAMSGDTLTITGSGKTDEEIQDIAGAMVTGNTETNITVTYQDVDGTIDFEVSSASSTTAGVIELATDAETNTGTATDRATTPANIEAWTGSAQVTTTGALDSGSITSNFGTIDIGSSALSTTGTITGPSGTWDSGGVDIAASDSYAVAGTAILSDSAGTMTLSNVDALDPTTEATVEAAIDTLANLVSVQGLTVGFADAGADAIWGWDDTAGTYENLTQAEVLAVIGDSSDTAKGVVELATDAETNTGTSTVLAITPANITAWTGDTALVTTGALDTGSITSGFGTIDTGSSAITTTGAVTGGASTFTASVNITNTGATAGILALEEPNGDSVVNVTAPALAASYTLTLPVDDGDSGEILSTNGSGVLSWAANAAGAALGDANEWTAIQSFVISDAGTNTVVRPAIVGHMSSDTVTAGFGVGLQFNAEVADGEDLPMAFIDAVSTDIDAGTEDFDLVFSTSTAGAAPAEVMRVTSTGVLSMDTALAVDQGGTGAATFTDGAILLGSGAGAITALDATTKGNLVVGDGTTDPVALSVGTDTHVLTADSAQASGIKWAAAAGGGGAWTYVSSTALTGASVAFTSLTATAYMLVFKQALSASDADIILTVSVDGCTYASADYQYMFGTTEVGDCCDTIDYVDSAIASSITLTEVSVGSAGSGSDEYGLSGTLIAYGTATASVAPTFTWEAGYQDGTGDLIRVNGSAVASDDGAGGSTENVVALKLAPSTGNWASGTVELYSLVTS